MIKLAEFYVGINRLGQPGLLIHKRCARSTAVPNPSLEAYVRAATEHKCPTRSVRIGQSA